MNASAIQQIVKEAQPMVAGGSPNGSPKNDTAIRNLIEMGNYTKRSYSFFLFANQVILALFLIWNSCKYSIIKCTCSN